MYGSGYYGSSPHCYNQGEPPMNMQPSGSYYSNTYPTNEMNYSRTTGQSMWIPGPGFVGPNLCNTGSLGPNVNNQKFMNQNMSQYSSATSTNIANPSVEVSYSASQHVSVRFPAPYTNMQQGVGYANPGTSRINYPPATSAEMNYPTAKIPRMSYPVPSAPNTQQGVRYANPGNSRMNYPPTAAMSAEMSYPAAKIPRMSYPVLSIADDCSSTGNHSGGSSFHKEPEIAVVSRSSAMSNPRIEGRNIVPVEKRSRVLRLSITNVTRPITFETLHKVCSQEGAKVVRIVICDRRENVVTTMVEFDSHKSAVNIEQLIDDREIFANCCLVSVSFADIEKLDGPENSEIMRDYGIDTFPEVKPAPLKASVSEKRLPSNLVQRYKTKTLPNRNMIPVLPKVAESVHCNEKTDCVKSLLLSNLPQDKLTRERLFNLFCQYGDVDAVWFDETGISASRDFAFIEMKTMEGANTALNYLKDSTIFGKKLEMQLLEWESSHIPCSAKCLTTEMLTRYSDVNLKRFDSLDEKYLEVAAPSTVLQFANAGVFVTQENLVSYLSQNGAPFPVDTIFSSHIAKIRVKFGVSTYCGFIKYNTIEEAAEALILNSNVEIRGHCLLLSFTTCSFPLENNAVLRKHQRVADCYNKRHFFLSHEPIVNMTMAEALKAGIRNIDVVIEDRVLVFSNLPRDKVNCRKVYNLLSQYGAVLRVKFSSSSSEVFVEMYSSSFAKNAQKFLHRKKIYDVILEVEISERCHQLYALYGDQELFHLPDGTPSFGDFTVGAPNRFTDKRTMEISTFGSPSYLLYVHAYPQYYLSWQFLVDFLGKNGNHKPVTIYVERGPKKPTLEDTKKRKRGFMQFPSAEAATEVLLSYNNVPLYTGLPSSSDHLLLAFANKMYLPTREVLLGSSADSENSNEKELALIQVVRKQAKSLRKYRKRQKIQRKKVNRHLRREQERAVTT